MRCCHCVLYVFPSCRIRTIWASASETQCPPPPTPPWLCSIWCKSLYSRSPNSPWTSIVAVWRLAQPRFPNGPNLEGLVWPSNHHTNPPTCAHLHKHTDTHFSKPSGLNNWCLSFWCICWATQVRQGLSECVCVCVSLLVCKCVCECVMFSVSSKIPHSPIITENMYCPLRHSS